MLIVKTFNDYFLGKFREIRVLKNEYSKKLYSCREF